MKKPPEVINFGMNDLVSFGVMFATSLGQALENAGALSRSDLADELEQSIDFISSEPAGQLMALVVKGLRYAPEPGEPRLKLVPGGLTDPEGKS